MNAYLRKEIRLLLPSFSAALVLAFSAWLLPLDPAHVSELRKALAVLPFVLCPVMMVLMSLDSFGREVASGTFSSLLAEPISRRRIWTMMALKL